MSVSDLQAKNNELEKKLAAATSQIEQLQQIISHNKNELRPKINQMSSEVVDSNPYR